MVGWHQQLNGLKFEQTPGDCEGQGSHVCCSPLIHKELEKTQQLNGEGNGTPLQYSCLVFASTCDNKLSLGVHIY